tara:strand:+ start:922 stop:1275 length:354 start_codon:yes stop_codon:yes gene_type:complete
MKVSIISVIFILVVHNILHFLTDTLTIPKIKDLVNAPHEKYQHIYSTIHKEGKPSTTNDQPSIHGTTDINSIPPISRDDLLPNLSSKNKQDMKNELKNFMKKQLTHDDNKPEFMSLS